MTAFPPSINGDAVLCSVCLAIFLAQAEPAGYNESVRPTAAAAHHPSVSSFRAAIAAGCTICRVVNKIFPATVKSSEDDGEPATKYTLTKKTDDGHDGHYLLAVFLNVDGLRSVTYFNAAHITQGTVINVPQAQHDALVRQWSLACCSGSGRHAACQQYRTAAASQTDATLQGPRRLMQLRVDDEEGGDNDKAIYFRLQAFGDDVDDDVVNGASVVYATVSRHVPSTMGDGDYYDPLLKEMADTGKLFSNWCALAFLPAWLQKAATAAVSAGMTYLWAPIAILGDEPPQGSFYTKAALNIALLGDGSTGAGGKAAAVEGKLPIVHPAWAPDHHHLLALYQPTIFSDTLDASRLTASADFHRAVLLAPSTLFLAGGHIWWQCTEGTLYGDLLATGAGPNSPSAMDIYGTHDENTADWLGTLKAAATAQTKDKPDVLAESLASFWTSVVTAFAQEIQATTAAVADRSSVIDDLAAQVQALAFPRTTTIVMTVPPPYVAHGVWSEGLVEQLAWRREVTETETETEVALPHRSTGEPTWSWLSVVGGATVAYEFILASGCPGLRTTTMRADAPRARRVAAAQLRGASSSPVMLTETAEAAAAGREPAALLLGTGRLLAAELDRSKPLNEGHLVVRDVHEGIATVDWDCVEDVYNAARSNDGKTDDGDEYFVWPLFVQVHDGDGGQGQAVDARGLLLLRRADGRGALSRCGWFQYSLRSSGGSGGGNAIVDMGRNDKIHPEQFVLV